MRRETGKTCIEITAKGRGGNSNDDETSEGKRRRQKSFPQSNSVFSLTETRPTP